MNKTNKFFINEESGQGMAEYALILALIVIVAVGAIVVLGEKTLELYDYSLSKLSF